MDVSAKYSFRDNWLAKALVYYQVIDQSLFDELAFRNSDEKFFAKILTDNDYLNDKEIRQFVKSALQIPTISLEKVDAEQDVLDVIPEEVCRRYNLLALQMDKTHIAVAFSNPFNMDAENEIEYLTRKYVKKFYALHDEIKQKINEYYAPEKIITSFVDMGKNVDIKFAGDTNLNSNSPVVKLVNQIIWDSITKKASDIHIEPQEKSFQVRFRIDGVLRNELEVPRSIHSALSSRIKIVSNLNIAETRKRQDGKAKVTIEDNDIDLRVSVLPTSFGKKIVIRILDKRNATVSFDKMGIVGYNRDQLEKCFQLKQGMVLVTGPTGSGKSTTLYAAINRIRSTTPHESHIYVYASGLRETAVLAVKVTDSQGNLVDQTHAVQVHFNILQGPDGGEYLDPDTITTESGLAFTVLNSGTISGAIQIEAYVELDGQTIRSIPSRIAIYGGLPDEEHFSIAIEKVNIAGLIHFGLLDNVTAIVGDKYSNPVAPGTIVYFSTDYGIIEGGAITDELGRATVRYISSAPLPPNPAVSSFAKINAWSYGDTLIGLTLSAETNLLLSGTTDEISISPTSFQYNELNQGKAFNFNISDIYENPIVANSVISVRATAGELFGNTQFTILDTRFPGNGTTDFGFVWTPGDSLDAPQVFITITVTSPPDGNGSRSTNISGSKIP